MRKEENLEKLIEEAKNGDAEALGRLYDLFVDKIYGYVHYKVGNEEEAKDLTENIFLKVLEKIKYYRGGRSSFAAWLFTIARNLIINYYKERSRSQTVSLNTLSEKQSKIETPEEAALKTFSQEMVYQALSQLTEEQQQVIVLRFFSNFSNREIGEIIDKSEGAVKSLQHRALKSLYRILRKAEKNE